MAIKLSHKTGVVTGKIELTSSKSESNRALIIQALCDDICEINNLAKAKDTQTLQRLLSSKEGILDVGHAGTVMRFLTAYLSLQKKSYILTGSDRMKQRPIKILVDALRLLGAKIEYLKEEGYPPLKIEGGDMNGGIVNIDGSVSSQYISALLMIAPQLKNGLIIKFKGEIVSTPYIKMTISMMQYFGVNVNWSGDTIEVKNANYKATELTIEADWSAASYWYSIAALSKKVDISLYGLKKTSLQGDAVVQNIYKKLGVNTEFIEKGIRLTNTNTSITNLNYDFENCPDIAQTVAVTCASLNISVTFTGLKTLRIKETDRIFALKTELNKLGFVVEVNKDDLIITSLKKEELISFSEGVVTYDDHRMAMAFAPLALQSSINIEDEDVVVKSYPAFWNDLESVDFKIEKYH